MFVFFKQLLKHLLTPLSAFTLLEDHMWLMLVMGVWGVGVGAFVSTYTLTMVHYMGLDNLMSIYGASMVCTAGGFLTIGPCAGG